jgi:hypothetical protein
MYHRTGPSSEDAKLPDLEYMKNEDMLPEEMSSHRPWAVAARMVAAFSVVHLAIPKEKRGGPERTSAISNRTRPSASPSAIARNDVRVG